MFEKFIIVSINEFDTNPLQSVSLLGFTWLCGLKYTDKKSQTLRDNGMILLLENKIRGGIESVLGDRYLKADDKKSWCKLMLIIYSNE